MTNILFTLVPCCPKLAATSCRPERGAGDLFNQRRRLK